MAGLNEMDAQNQVVKPWLQPEKENMEKHKECASANMQEMESLRIVYLCLIYNPQRQDRGLCQCPEEQGEN